MKNILLTGLVITVLLAGAAVWHYTGDDKAMEMTAVTLEDPASWSPAQRAAATQRHMDSGIKAGDIDPDTGLQVLNYYDPMMPASKFDSPGPSPFMDMLLVPAYANNNSDSDSSTVSISPRLQQNTGIRTALVSSGSINPSISATGTLNWNERSAQVLQARASGYIEALLVRAEFDRVVQGQALAEIHVPDWVAVQEEYLALTRMQSNDLASLLEAATRRMKQLGMNDEQIAQFVNTREIHNTTTITAPLNGIITELGVREGATVQTGDMLFRIQGTASLWADIEVPESQTAMLATGAAISATTPSLPGAILNGTVQSLLPEINQTLRTRKVRIELPNPEGNLVMGMLLQVNLAGSSRDNVVLVPNSALIPTGKRTVVIVQENAGSFTPVEVQTGIESRGQTEILRGLQVGQRVVLSGQFLLDSEASLRGLEARLLPESDMPNTDAGETP